MKIYVVCDVHEEGVNGLVNAYKTLDEALLFVKGEIEHSEKGLGNHIFTSSKLRKIISKDMWGIDYEGNGKLLYDTQEDRGIVDYLMVIEFDL